MITHCNWLVLNSCDWPVHFGPRCSGDNRYDNDNPLWCLKIKLKYFILVERFITSDGIHL